MNRKKQQQKKRQLQILTLVILTVVIIGGITALVYLIGHRGEKTSAEQENSVEAVVTEASETETPQTEMIATEIASEEPEIQTETAATEEMPQTSEQGGHIVVLDAGHQSQGNSAKEPNGPGSQEMKAKVTGGTKGTTTGVYEYQLNLDIALKLQAELEKRGYTVYMTRTTNDVDISNVERAQYATSVGGEIFIRIHANGSENSSASGALALAPSKNNSYVSGIASESQRLSQCILDAYCAKTGMSNQGLLISDTMTGINWASMPVTIMEMGYMTNPSDDKNMEDESFQEKMVQGMADGVDAYFKE